MHLIVPFAATATLLERVVAGSMVTPQLDALARRWAEVRRDSADVSTLSPPHERAWAAALGWAAPDGCLPWAAQQAAADAIDVAGRPWGLLTPAHWRVGSDGVHLADPALLELGETESRALFHSVQALFASEGFATAWGAPLRWYVAHDVLQGVACASPDRVIGRNIDAWVPRQPEAKRLRRLQNEAQMLLHWHPVNEAREAAGALAVNSFWLSGCGSAQPSAPTGARLDDRLRAPALRDDAAGWSEAWRTLDREALVPLQAAAARGEAVRLTLCGERAAVELAPRTGAWQRVVASFRPRRDNARALLESL